MSYTRNGGFRGYFAQPDFPADEYFMHTALIGEYEGAVAQKNKVFRAAENALSALPKYADVNSTNMAELAEFVQKYDDVWVKCDVSSICRDLRSIKDAADLALDNFEPTFHRRTGEKITLDYFEGKSKRTWNDCYVDANSYLKSIESVREDCKRAKQGHEVLKEQERSIEKQQGLRDGSFFLNKEASPEKHDEHDRAASLGFK